MADLKGTNVPSKIVPYTTSDNYATHDEEYGVGGYRTVNSVSEMNAIPDARRKEGMLVNVKGDKIYKLNSSNTFVDAGLSGGGSNSVYYVNSNNLNFSDISDGDSASDDQVNEVSICLTNWIQEKTIIYNNYSSILTVGDYIGVLNMGFNISDNTVSFMLPYNQQGTGAYLYSIDMTNKVWTVQNLGEGGGGSDWNSGYNLSKNGYQKFNNGLMIQWGYMSPSSMNSTTGQQIINLPLSFYDTYYTVVTTVISTHTSPIVKEIVSKYKSYFIIKSIQYGTIAGEPYNWFAIGRWK